MGSVKASFEMLASSPSARFLTVFSCPHIPHSCHGVWTTSYLRGSLPRAESFLLIFWVELAAWGGPGQSLRTFIPPSPGSLGASLDGTGEEAVWTVVGLWLRGQSPAVSGGSEPRVW